jgi:hypothetical protein
MKITNRLFVFSVQRNLATQATPLSGRLDNILICAGGGLRLTMTFATDFNESEMCCG